jgi:DNA-binding CsgD family transcriptional regulator
MWLCWVMVRLGNADFEAVLGVVRAVTGAGDPEEFSRVVVKRVADLIPSDVVTINEVDPEAGRTVYLAEPESFPGPPNGGEILAALADQHPLIHHFLSTGDGSAHRISDFWSQSKYHATPIYQHLYRPMGVEYQMAVTLPAPRPIVVGIALSRCDSDFSERDRSVLNVLRPHLAQAWYNAKDQGHLRAVLGAASEATAESGAGLIVLSDPPQELTPGALVSLYRFFGRPTAATGPLPLRVERWMESQQARLQGEGALALELVKPLRAEIDGRQMVLRYLPGQAVHPGVLLLREELRRPQEQNFDALGLTAREAEIVTCVVRGESNAMIGESLHVSPTTVKKHLDNVYLKVGVRGRGRLTAFVLDVLEREPVFGSERRAESFSAVGRDS